MKFCNRQISGRWGFCLKFCESNKNMKRKYQRFYHKIPPPLVLS